MTPGARIAAVIDLLGEIAAADAPADRTMTGYLRARRYIGAKDRRAIGDLAYTVLRHRARLDWWQARIGPSVPGERARRAVIAGLVMVQKRAPDELDRLLDGAPHHPAPLRDGERRLADALAGCDPGHPEQPAWVRGEMPEWLLPELGAVFGPELEAGLAALADEAPLDLRVNALKGSPADAAAALAEAGIAVERTRYSPIGLRVQGRRAVSGSAAFSDGLVEVQDEGSQLVALLSDARPGMSVADFCAGAGGKTLALAAAMENRGRLVAMDVSQKRLDRAARRLRRAGVGIVERRVLRGGAGPTGDADGFDRVLVDAPCSGSGAWRRSPDARWRLTPDRLAAYRAAQADALGHAAPLVRPGGRLIYATCSLLPTENRAQVEDFLALRPGFTLLPAERVWREVFGAPPPEPSPIAGAYLALTPHRHGTDGFFAAVLERAAGR